MNRLEFSCFVDFLHVFLKPRVESGFLSKSASRNTVDNMEQESFVKLMCKNSISEVTENLRKFYDV
jgi:hypothetical protein